VNYIDPIWNLWNTFKGKNNSSFCYQYVGANITQQRAKQLYITRTAHFLLCAYFLHTGSYFIEVWFSPTMLIQCRAINRDRWLRSDKLRIFLFFLSFLLIYVLKFVWREWERPHRMSASLVYVMFQHCLNRFVKVSLLIPLVAVNLLSPVSRGGT